MDGSALLHESNTEFKIDPDNSSFPFCIVWTPIPFLTWLFPLIGHVGICTSTGEIHDFAGSYRINIDKFAFGDPVKYVEIQVPQCDRDLWDEAVRLADFSYAY